MPSYVFAGSLTRPAPNYREANGRGITTLRIDDESGRLEVVSTYAAIDDTGWLSVDAARRRLYAVCEDPDAGQSLVASFAVGPEGGLTELNRQPTGGQTACHMSLSGDGRFLLVANYNADVAAGAPDGAIAVLSIGPNGELLPASALLHHHGRGPHPARQERSHAHCIVAAPDGGLVYVTDLGLDRIMVYALGADGRLSHQAENDFALAPGSGPRHLVFQPDGRRLFVVMELSPSVVSLEVGASGAMTLIDSLAIPRNGNAIVQPAGILLGPDGRLFVGLRECNEILGIAVDGSGKLAPTGRWPSGGATPRDFVLSPDGRHLIVANQDSDNLTSFPVSRGTLGAPMQNLAVGTPMAVAIADFGRS